jgi:hypothetical protein
VTQYQVEVIGRHAEGTVTRFTVRIDGRSYDVGVPHEYVSRLVPGSDAAELLHRSMLFLLEREPPESILRRFDLPVISRYFPEYESAMRGTEP